jgi:hypothetical protein
MAKAQREDLSDNAQDLVSQKKLLEIKMKMLQAQLHLQSQQQKRGRVIGAQGNKKAPFGRTSSNYVERCQSPINDLRRNSTSPIRRREAPGVRSHDR